MIWPIIFTVALILALIFFAIDDFDYWWSRTLFLIVIIPVACIISVFMGVTTGAIISTPFNNFLPIIEVKDSTTQIYSLQDNSSMSAQFSLGRGYIDEELNIFYITELNDIKHIESVRASKVNITESSIDTPQLTITHKEYENFIWKLFFIIDSDTQYYFTVPKGTIYTNYVIDLQ